jgi:hypothetical protein
MGYHYVPQRHLRRFEIDEKPKIIWMYDKRSGQFKEVSIKNTAQEKDYYAQDTEQALGDCIEVPGNNAIDKLLGREDLDHAERSQLAIHMMIMANRGPRKRRQIQELTRATFAEVQAESRAEIEKLIQENGADVELALALLKEQEAAEMRYAQSLPERLQALIRVPFWTTRTVECILNMTWHIVPAPSSMFYVTCDTPAHIFDEKGGVGVGTIHSEFTFALSKDIALIGEHHSGRPCTTVFEKPQARLTKEINRRTLSHADRFVYSHCNADWISTIIKKGVPQLNRINWSVR